MSSGLILSLLVGYFIFLYIISWYTSKNVTNKGFFTAGRKSPWYLIAYSMIGTSISGVTFISIPGVVGAGGANQAFSYMQFVFGYLVGYIVIAFVLMPLYYRLNLTTIYGYLEQRLGWHAYKTGAGFFLLSRSVGSAFRLFLAAMVFQEFLMKSFGVPFWLTVTGTIGLVWLFTYKGGLKTVIWTDAIQTTMFLLAVVLTISFIGREMGLSFGGIVNTVSESQYSKMFFWDDFWGDPNHFAKQFISGMLITIVMTGLDQDMMQKNLSCRNLRDAQKNMLSFSVVLIGVNLLFLSMGALLYLYAAQAGIAIPAKSDQLYPIIAFQHLPELAAVVFIFGLASATYASSDSALTSLTTSFCVDFLNFEKNDKDSEQSKQRVRQWVHAGFAALLVLLVMLFDVLNNDAVISKIFEAAGYTYGPVLGLFAFGIFTRRRLPGRLTVLICILAPIISFCLNYNSQALFGGLKIGFLIIAVNGLLTFLGLYLISRKAENKTAASAN